jgi:hypothetical protein
MARCSSATIRLPAAECIGCASVPYPDVAEFDRVVAALEKVGVNDAHLALD